jgi:hypothetical protein
MDEDAKHKLEYESQLQLHVETERWHTNTTLTGVGVAATILVAGIALMTPGLKNWCFFISSVVTFWMLARHWNFSWRERRKRCKRVLELEGMIGISVLSVHRSFLSYMKPTPKWGGGQMMQTHLRY